MTASPAHPPLDGMHYSYTTALSDGCKLAYQTSIPAQDIPAWFSSSSSTSNQEAAAAAAADPTNKRGSQKKKTCLILIHGFSGSSHYFVRNAAALSSSSSSAGGGDRLWVVCPDLRGHGASGRTRGGYHVARLAADLRDLVAHLREQLSTTSNDSEDKSDDINFVPVGCSIGSAVLWTYAELFGTADFAGWVFVDQGPLQDRRGRDLLPAHTTEAEAGEEVWDETKAHKGCYDEATLRAAQRAWVHDTAAAHRDLVEGCLGYYSPRQKLPEEGDDLLHDDGKLYAGLTPAQREADMRHFTGISALGDPAWLSRLMEDHTRYDHREACELLTGRPSLVMAGRRSACFPLEGMRETVRRVEKGWERERGRRRRDEGEEEEEGEPLATATWSLYDSGHWLYYEEPERFNREIVEFVERL